ncbi:cell division protein FtsQ/DivIB [Bowmanella pacifica]|uniref:Cell division protein FtsQ n=1 Tax=Bowmanella pacifica TaxID=502051 RepID=A0A918DIJ0_9ALTE|nr:cell division protein FtsQ [Bowmanella pacifica]
MNELQVLPTPARGPQLWWGMLFLFLVLSGLVYGAFSLNAWLDDEQQLPVRDIQISGKLTYLVKQDVELAIRRNQPGSFFELDIQRALQDVEALPWVYRASIRKEWPNNLHVHVVEQQAVASWNGDMLLNIQGGTFAAAVPEGLLLPKLFGPQGSEQTALQGFHAMQALLLRSDVQVDELVLSERFAWNLKLDNGLRLNLGRDEFIDRLQRFVDIYPLLQKDQRQAEYVDLRYDTGLAVGWKPASAATSG